MLSPIKTNLSQKLKDKGYRERFFRGRVQDEIAFQLKAARKKRGRKQSALAQLSGMKQSAISRLEQSSYSKWNFKTLLRIASALDLRIRVNFDFAEDVIAAYELEDAISGGLSAAPTAQQNMDGVAGKETGGDLDISDLQGRTDRYSSTVEQSTGV